MRPLPRCLLLVAAAVLTGTFCYAQDSDAPIPPPPAHCDSYSMENLPNLTLQQKTCFWRDQLFTGNAVTGAALWGAVAEWRHKPPEWPQGFNGFGRQFGTRYTQGMVKSTTAFLVGAALREDPRALPPTDLYCPGRATNVWPRLGQSLARVVWTRRSDCTGEIAFSRLAGSLATGFVGLAWAPPSANKLNSAWVGTGTAFGGYLGNSVYTEFQGDIFRFVGKIFTTGKPKAAKP